MQRMCGELYAQAMFLEVASGLYVRSKKCGKSIGLQLHCGREGA